MTCSTRGQRTASSSFARPTRSNTWPNWRNFSDRIIKPGDIVFMDLAALTWNGYKSCYYRTYCAGKEPTKEQKDIYATALKWLYDSIKAVKVGTTTREIALPQTFSLFSTVNLKFFVNSKGVVPFMNWL